MTYILENDCHFQNSDCHSKENPPVSRNVNYFPMQLVTFGNKSGKVLTAFMSVGGPQKNKQMKQCVGLGREIYIFTYL